MFTGLSMYFVITMIHREVFAQKWRLYEEWHSEQQQRGHEAVVPTAAGTQAAAAGQIATTSRAAIAAPGGPAASSNAAIVLPEPTAKVVTPAKRARPGGARAGSRGSSAAGDKRKPEDETATPPKIAKVAPGAETLPQKIKAASALKTQVQKTLSAANMFVNKVTKDQKYEWANNKENSGKLAEKIQAVNDFIAADEWICEYIIAETQQVKMTDGLTGRLNNFLLIKPVHKALDKKLKSLLNMHKKALEEMEASE